MTRKSRQANPKSAKAAARAKSGSKRSPKLPRTKRTKSDAASTWARKAAFVPTKAQVMLEDFIELPERIDSESESAVIMFADLVGSTEFKMERSAAEGLRKVVIHNRELREAVNDQDGHVAKMLGDGMLAYFLGEDGATRALTAAVAAQKRIERANAANRWGRTHPSHIKTRLAIHKGDVWWLAFEESTVFDPHGETVDVASRLLALVPPEQIIMSKSAWDAIPKKKDWSFSQMEQRRIRGRREAIEVCLAGSKRTKEFGTIGYAPHSVVTPRDMKPLLGQADHAYLEGEFGKAEQLYDEFLQKVPSHGHANIRFAKILLRRSFDDMPAKEVVEVLSRARRRICVAKQVVDDDGRVWSLLAQVRFKAFEARVVLKGDDPLEAADIPEFNLDRAIQNARQAEARALERRAHNRLAEAQAQLAEYFLRRSKNGFGNQSDYDKARALCRELASFANRHIGQTQSNCFIVMAKTIIEGWTNAKEFEAEVREVESLIESARAASPDNPRLFEVQGLLAKRKSDFRAGS